MDQSVPDRIQDYVLSGARLSAVLLLVIIAGFTSISLALGQPAESTWFGWLPPDLGARFAVFLGCLVWLLRFRRPCSTAFTGFFVVFATMGVQLITVIQLNSSGTVNHPFILAPSFVLLALGMFVPVNPLVYLVTAVGLAFSQGGAIRIGYIPADSVMLWLALAISTFAGVIGAVASMQRRLSLRSLFDGQDELRDRAVELETTLDALQRVREQLVISDRMAILGRLTAAIAHEVSTPLASTRMSLREIGALQDELRASVGHPDVTEEDFREILRELDQARELAQTATARAAQYITDLKQQTVGLDPNQVREFNVSDELQFIRNLLRYRTRGSCGEVDLECDESITATGDVGKFGQVLTNLITNALDATEGRKPQDAIQVRAEARNGHVEIRVIDRGPGVPPEIAPRILDPLFSTKPSGTGLGLGLSICRDIIVGSFAGTLRHEDTPGGGATFVVVLPTG